MSTAHPPVTLTERRAIFVYEAARLAAGAAGAQIVRVFWGDREESFRQQFLRVIERQCGPQRAQSPEELRGSFLQASYFEMDWIYGEQYSPEAKTQRDRDAVFVALCEIARQWICEVAAGDRT